MRKILTGAIIALGLTGAALATTGTASAERVGVSLNFGNVAFGYQDGYWDRGHRWHRGEMARYQLVPANHYYAWHHDRDHDMGWHE